MNPVHGGEEPGTALRVHEHTPMAQDGEEGTKSLLTGGEGSADVLMTQLCPLRLEEVVVTKNALPDGRLEHCTAQATSEENSSEACETIRQDVGEKEDKVQPALEMMALNDCNMELGRDVSGHEQKINSLHSQKLMVVKQIVKHIKSLPQDSLDSCSSAVRCQGMLLITDYSDRNESPGSPFTAGMPMGAYFSTSKVKPPLEGKEKLDVVIVCVASVFALPSIEALQRQEGHKVNVKDLYNQSVDALEVMLRALLSEKPNPAELQNFLDHLAPWMRSEKAHERARAVNTSVCLLQAAAEHPKFCMSHEFPRLGLLVGRLALCIGDPEKEIGHQAMEGLYFLYSLMWCQKEPERKMGSVTAVLHQMPKEILGIYEPTRTCQNISEIVKRFGQFLSPDQIADLLLTAVESLKKANESTIEASKTILNVILEKYKHKIQMKVPKILDRIHSQLRAIHHSHARQVVMMALCLLARAFMEEVSTALLKCPLPLDRDAAGMWRTLAKTEAICHSHRLLDVLLKELQERPSTSEDKAFIIPIAAASALCEVLSVSMCTQTVTRFYPRLLMALLVQVHYSIGLSLSDSGVSRKELIPACCVVKTVKTLLLKMGCHYEFTSVEKEGGWELLTSSEEHHRGVGLLARAMVHYSCCELWRILYLLVPFLERGDKQHKLTAMAFFIELLHMPQAKRLPEKYSVIRLLKGLTDPDPIIRALCVKGLITMADWPGKEIKVLVPAMINSLCGVDGRLVVEALADVKKILRGLDGASYAGCITSPLRLLFDDERASVRSAAISLFGKMVKKVKKSRGLMKEEDVLDSLIPLLLHLQEGNPDMAEKCKNALDECSRLLEWRLPKQVGNRKAWHNHQKDVDEICQYLVKTRQENVQRFLFQSQCYLSSTQPSLRRAAAMFIGFLVMHMDNMMGMKDLDIISNALRGLLHDPEASVCIFAAQARERVLAVSWKLKYGLVEQHKVNSDSAEKHKSPPNPPPTESTSSRLFNALNLWKLAAKH
ncbi:maestro heat-like repeat-containing protein family member 7 isoform X2 [Dermochelys coriacea]|uniref:maestro heat-like repeat-containing protein family member 7 isoform X2 n=1 Tax=Dermochelys coriacea TaxID=27794 RepID=UPI001CAA36D2|nr:maestro heat-like repeat-containing protein family member 7 isoform X2 [Dermochelys coriacea]